MTTKMVWPVHVTASTRTPDGKRHRIDRMVDAAGDVEGAMLWMLTQQRNPDLWLGCEIVGVTPIGQIIKRVFESKDGYYCLIS